MNVGHEVDLVLIQTSSFFLVKIMLKKLLVSIRTT